MTDLVQIVSICVSTGLLVLVLELVRRRHGIPGAFDVGPGG